MTSLTFVAPLARAAEPPPLPEPPVIRAARAVIQPQALEPTFERPAPWERDETLAHVSLAIGGVGFLTAGVSLLMKKRSAAAGDACRFGNCQPPSREDRALDEALGKATTIGTIVGVAGGVTGALLLISAEVKKNEAKRKRLSAVVSPSRVGIKLRF